MTLTRIAPSLLAVPCAGAVLRLEDGCPNTKLLGVVFRCPLSQHDPFLHLPKLTGINYVPQYSWRYSYNLLLGQTLRDVHVSQAQLLSSSTATVASFTNV